MNKNSRDGFTPRHTPVMVNEVFEAMNLMPGDTYVDGTLGLGGHALEAAKRISPNGTIYGFDWDKSMLEIGKGAFDQIPGVKFHAENMSFFDAPEYLSSRSIVANGILLDLGLNSAQIDDPFRGFSFQEGPLDMRMNISSGEPAAALLNRLTLQQLENLLFEKGDERWARAIAKQIVERRKDHPLRTTTDLIECVLAAVPVKARDKRIHPATRTFQAIRIMVTGELDGLASALDGLKTRLSILGTLVVLSYHSGEDKIVKQFMKLSGQNKDDSFAKYIALYSKPIQPTAYEITNNRRARSARMRALRRVA